MHTQVYHCQNRGEAKKHKLNESRGGKFRNFDEKGNYEFCGNMGNMHYAICIIDLRGGGRPCWETYLLTTPTDWSASEKLTAPADVSMDVRQTTRYAIRRSVLTYTDKSTNVSRMQKRMQNGPYTVNMFCFTCASSLLSYNEYTNRTLSMWRSDGEEKDWKSTFICNV